MAAPRQEPPSSPADRTLCKEKNLSDLRTLPSFHWAMVGALPVVGGVIGSAFQSCEQAFTYG